MGFLRQLIANLRAGARLLMLRPVAATDFVVSFDQLVALLAIVLALLTGLDRLLSDDEAVFDPYGYFTWAYYLLGGVWAAALIARVQGPNANTRPLLVVWLAAVPGLIVALALLLLVPFVRERPLFAFAAAGGVLIAMSERAVRKVYGFARPGTLLLIVATIVGLPWVFQKQLYLEPQLWVVSSSDESAQAGSGAGAGADEDAEALLFDQADRIAEAVDHTAPQRPGRVDSYYLGFAGYGEQSVFRSEALFAEKVFAKRFGTGPRSIELINDREDRDTYPLATVSGLQYALQLLGERMDKDEDVLVLFLTSHGSREGLAVSNGRLPLADLQPGDLRRALDDSGIKWRIVVVSACYAGIFLQPLKSDSTLVITAADANHSSFGCADDRDLTYFGEAFLRDALPGAPTLEAAFAKARRLIAERESAERLRPSNPQISVGAAIRRKLAAPEGTLEHAPEDSEPDDNVPGTVTASAGPAPSPRAHLGRSAGRTLLDYNSNLCN